MDLSTDRKCCEVGAECTCVNREIDGPVDDPGGRDDDDPGGVMPGGLLMPGLCGLLGLGLLHGLWLWHGLLHGLGLGLLLHGLCLGLLHGLCLLLHDLCLGLLLHGLCLCLGLLHGLCLCLGLLLGLHGGICGGKAIMCCIILKLGLIGLVAFSLKSIKDNGSNTVDPVAGDTTSYD